MSLFVSIVWLLLFVQPFEVKLSPLLPPHDFFSILTQTVDHTILPVLFTKGSGGDAGTCLFFTVGIVA